MFRCTTLFCLSLLLLGAGAIAQTIQPAQLRCEYLENPIALDSAAPRFTWASAPVEQDARGVAQSAYQILVASSEKALASDEGDLWDSGKVESNKQQNIRYSGKELCSRARAFWKVQLWDAADKVSAWSEPAHFTVGLLAPEDWQAQWIGLGEQEAESQPHALQESSWIWFNDAEAPAVAAPPGERFFLKTFEVKEDQAVEEAYVMTIGDNEFQVYVNGARVDQGGGWQGARRTAIAEQIKPGTNVLAASVNNSGPNDNPAGFACALRIEFAEGDPVAINTGADWMARESAPDGWPEVKAADDSWEAAKVLGDHGMAPWGETKSVETERTLPARMLRKEFEAKAVVRATAHVSGLGFYELYLNGAKVGDRVLEPALSGYSDLVYYTAYNVTDMIAAGENAVGVMLGNGRYFAPRLAAPTSTLTYGFPKLLCQIELEHADGTTSTIVSDTSWKITEEGPIRANNVYDGEEYDARMEMAGWAEPGFDDSAWEEAKAVDAPGGVVVPQMIQPRRVTEILTPIAVTEPEPGMYVFDMGQNMVGWARIRVEGPAGKAVRLRFAEQLKDDGTIYLANIRGAKVTDLYTLKGEGVETYEPRFTFHGFRFVEVIGWPGEPGLDDIEGCVVHTDAPPAGEFASSNAFLNQLYGNIRWGVRGNIHSIPFDCPQRDERQGWLGDIATESRSESYMLDMARFWPKWLRDIRESQQENGALPDVAPPYWPIYSDNITWPAAYIIIAEWYQRLYDDVQIVEDNYDAMKKWMEHMGTFLEDGIMPRDTYGDWCVPPEDPKLIHSEDPARKTAGPILGTTYYYQLLRSMERFAGLIGNDADAKHWAQMASDVRDAFNAKYLDKDKGVYDNGTQTSSVLPLFFGMTPEAQCEAVFENLVTSIVEKNDMHLATGLIGGQWLMRTLSDNGRADIAYNLATQRSYPSWGYMIDNGATTIWELWNGNTADPAMNSHNHVMLVGDLQIWMYEYLGGIHAPTPDTAGFSHVVIKPYVVGDLTEVKAHTERPNGRIATHWQRDGDEVTLTAEIPANSTATIAVPTLGNDVTITESGQTVWENGKFIEGVPGIKSAKKDGDWIVFETGSGVYTFK
jgi:alpha-L-rhamnosidase